MCQVTIIAANIQYMKKVWQLIIKVFYSYITISHLWIEEAENIPNGKSNITFSLIVQYGTLIGSPTYLGDCLHNILLANQWLIELKSVPNINIYVNA